MSWRSFLPLMNVTGGAKINHLSAVQFFSIDDILRLDKSAEFVVWL
jgi:hypothetical protein